MTPTSQVVEPGASTFARLLRKHLQSGAIRREDAILVQFAGTFDEQVCAELELGNCTFLNIAPDSPSSNIGGIPTDAHHMPYESASFDHVIGHSGLHHCSRPHEALHEMYRVARKTVLFVENQDSMFMRLATRAGVVSWHELPAVIAGDYTSGGVDGTGVPNFVYRWTRRELRKTVASFDPAYEVPIEFHSEWNLGSGRVSSQVLQRKLHLGDERAERLLTTGQHWLNALAARGGNIFAATIRKDLARLHPWMESPTRMKRT